MYIKFCYLEITGLSLLSLNLYVKDCVKDRREASLYATYSIPKRIIIVIFD